MLSEQEYYDYYYKIGKCIDQIQTPTKPLNERTLATKYQNYKKKENRKLEKEQNKKPYQYVPQKGTLNDEKWQEIKRIVFNRDKGKCQLIEKLSKIQLKELKFNGYELYQIIDPAHIIPKASFPKCYYDSEVIVCLNRYSHSMLDQQKHPLNGEAISKIEVTSWWMFIVGQEKYNYIINKYVLSITSDNIS